MVAGRRSGKSYATSCFLGEKALAGPNRNVFHVFPTYGQGKQVAWKQSKDMLRPYASSINQSDLSIDLVNGSFFAIRSADNPDSLRGVGLDGVGVEEFADQDPGVWEEIIRPALADRKGGAIINGTPKGWDHFKALHDKRLHNPNWFIYKYTTLQGGLVDEEEVNEARAEMDERIFRQEFEASFETIEGRVYRNFDDSADGNVRPCHYLGGDIVVGMDFNVDPMTAVLGQVVTNPAGVQCLEIFAEIVLSNANTEMMGDHLLLKWGGKHILVYPDPAGNQRHTNATLGQTDHQILRDFGFEVFALGKAPGVVDRINEVNALLRNMQGLRRLIIDPSCLKLRHALSWLKYLPGTSKPDKNSGLDHITDALGYLVHGEFPMNIYRGSGTIKTAVRG